MVCPNSRHTIETHLPSSTPRRCGGWEVCRYGSDPGAGVNSNGATQGLETLRAECYRLRTRAIVDVEAYLVQELSCVNYAEKARDIGARGASVSSLL